MPSDIIPLQHFSIYNLAEGPSPAANHSALFDYSAELNNKILRYVYALYESIHYYSQERYGVFKGQPVLA